MRIAKYILIFLVLFVTLSIASAQNRTVTGTVYFASDKSPVVGAYVQVEGASKVGTTTNLD
nr:hypothetical protein [Bacteroidales bacterium]